MPAGRGCVFCRGVLPVILAMLFVGLLITIHESGHYLAARWGGMRVNRFSIGFGPILYKRQVGETQFQVAAIPLGGFVDIAGLAENDGTEPSDPRSFQNRSFAERFTAVLAGPVANYATALLVFWVYFAAFNVERTGPFRVLQVDANSAAAEGGLETGDLIVGTADAKLTDRAAFLAAIQGSEGQPLRLDVIRDGEALQISVAPQPVNGGYRLGIQFDESTGVAKPLGVFEGLSRSVARIWTESKMLLTMLSRLVTGSGSGTLGGPIEIVRQLAGSIDAAPVAAFATVGSLSVALGLLNLLPIPALDGARLVFLLVGAIRRQRVPPRIENTIHSVGVLLLLGLMLVISWNDVLRWLGG